MGADKVPTKGEGFFHLFDWNSRKSRKKLFSNGNSPEKTKQIRRSVDNFPSTRFCQIDNDGNDEIGEVSSVVGSGDYSCASSVTDGEGNGCRAPGVVARLMGLDSLPTTGVSEPCSTPLCGPRFIRESRQRSPEFEVNRQFTNVQSRTGAYPGNLPEWKLQRMPSSPVERFQRDFLPPRSAKSIQINPYKLLSPAKNPRFVSSKDAAHLMEAAAKILDPGYHANSRSKVSQVGSSSLPLRVQDPKECNGSSKEGTIKSKECIAASQRSRRLEDLTRKPIESNAMKYLQGKPLNKSWNGTECDSSYRFSPDRSVVEYIGAKSKGKSISLAIQAKVNVQRREGLSMSSGSQKIDKEHDEHKMGQPCRNQTSTPSNRPQKKVSIPSSFGVLKQNNQKQNSLTSKDKLPAKRSLSSHQGRKVLSGDPCSSGRNKSTNKLHVNSKSGCRKEGIQTVNFEKEVSSLRADNLPRKKRLIDGNHNRQKSEFTDNILVSRLDKHVQPNVIIDEKLKRVEDSRREDGMDVVSFTFTSPVLKQTHEFQSLKMERKDVVDDYHADVKERNTAFFKNKRFPSLGSEILGGDALSVLLEQKLRELALDLEPTHPHMIKDVTLKASSTSQDSLSSTEITASEVVEQRNGFQWRSCQDNDLVSVSNSGFSSVEGPKFNLRHKLQVAESLTECSSSSSDANKEPDYPYQSPFSVLEASFSNESCNSSESYDSANGTDICSAIEAQDACTSVITVIQSLENETDLSDSASSFLETVDKERLRIINKTDPRKKYKQELKYVKEILFTANVQAKNVTTSCTSETLSTLLFDLIEEKLSVSARSREDNSDRPRRKVLFDCVKECLDIKYNRHFNGGYQTWIRGMSVIKWGELAEEIYKEISEWERMRDWMVDELVDKDMSSQVGKWVDFERVAFEAGVEIEDEILRSLVDEVVAELLV